MVILDYNFSENNHVVNVILRNPLTDSSRDCRSHFAFGILAGLIEQIHGISKCKILDVQQGNQDMAVRVGVDAITPTNQ